MTTTAISTATAEQNAAVSQRCPSTAYRIANVANGITMPATLCSLWGNVDFDVLDVEQQREGVERAYREGVLTQYDTILPGMKPILDLAGSLGMTVCLHPSTLEDLHSLLSAFPKTNMVIAHPESAWGLGATYELAQQHENMFIDLSGSGLFRMGMLHRGVDIMGSERILFGTDYPICNPAMNVAGVLFEKLDDFERKNILRENFIRLTGISQC